MPQNTFSCPHFSSTHPAGPLPLVAMHRVTSYRRACKPVASGVVIDERLGAGNHGASGVAAGAVRAAGARGCALRTPWLLPSLRSRGPQATACAGSAHPLAASSGAPAVAEVIPLCRVDVVPRKINWRQEDLEGRRDPAQQQHHSTTGHRRNNHHSNTMSSEAAGSKRKARDSAPFDPPRSRTRWAPAPAPAPAPRPRHSVCSC